MDKQGQSAIEYLLLIGGAILVVAIVLVILNSLGILGTSTTNTAFDKVGNAWNELKE